MRAVERSWRRIIRPASSGRAALWISAAVLMLLVFYAVFPLWWLVTVAFVLQLAIWVAYRLMSEPDDGEPSASQKRADAVWGYLKYAYFGVIVLGMLALVVLDGTG
jgi:type III secretory pathway component EscV